MSDSGTLGMKSKARVTVVVTWVCVKDSSSIQSGWRDGNMNLVGGGETERRADRALSTDWLVGVEEYTSTVAALKTLE